MQKKKKQVTNVNVPTWYSGLDSFSTTWDKIIEDYVLL